MKPSSRRTVATIVLIGLPLLLVGCLSMFRPSEPVPPGLIMGGPTCLSDGSWTVTIAAHDIPDGGLAGLLVRSGAIAFKNVIRSSITATGRSGFIVTAQDFEGSSPNEMLIAIHPSRGIASGKILKLAFQSTGGDPLLTIDEARVILVSDWNTLLP